MLWHASLAAKLHQLCVYYTKDQRQAMISWICFLILYWRKLQNVDFGWTFYTHPHHLGKMEYKRMWKVSFVPLTPSIVWTYHTDQTRSFSKSLKCEYRREFGSEGLKIKVKMFMPSLIKKNDCTFSGVQTVHFFQTLCFFFKYMNRSTR